MDNKKGDIKKLLKKYKKPDKKNINEIFPNEKILKLTNWSQYDDWEDINLEGIESIIKSNDKNNNTSINEFYIPQIVITNNLVGIDDEYMILKANENQTNIVDIIEDEEKIKDSITINNFLYGLENIKPNNDLQLNIEDIFGRNIGNKYFYLDFCNKIIKARGEDKTLYEFKIFSNLEYLTNILNIILDDIKNDLLSKKLTEDYYNSYKIFDKIICIGEKSVNEETYMCSILSKNKIFKDKNIWINSIKNKIISLLSDICFKEYSSKNQDSVFRPDEFIKNKIFGKIGGLIHFKEKNIIELSGFNKTIKYYNKLTKEQKKNIDDNALSIYHGVIKCYIRHITNYNFNLVNSVDIISEICSNLKIDNQQHSIFYCYYYHDCIYTCKRILDKNNISPEIREKINNIKSKNKSQDNYIFDLKNDHNKFIIIKKACKYLNDKDKLKLIHLGKYYEKIKKTIYKSFLKKDIPIEKRLNFWKLYLKLNTTKILYNYKDILKETSTEIFQNENSDSILQINKDIKRTYLRKKNENSPNQIYNILISFVYSDHKVNYVQGINHITGFLFDLTENEEDTFYLLINLFTMTQLSDIYNDEEFQYLKTLFYTIERLVYLYLPKIYSKLKDNNIQINFFMSAYFITLYTILYPNLPENDISFLLHLWDDFILDGWCSFFSNWLAILKYHEKEILPLENEQVLNFLTNKIKDSELYRKENYEKFYQLKKKYKITEELVKNLQNEIFVEAGIRKVGTSTIIEDFNTDDKVIQDK